MNKILWLVSWYPNKTSPLNGDFIQRHAEAVARQWPVHVIFVVKDESGIKTGNTRVEHYTRGNLSESIAYYNPVKTGIGFLNRMISLLTYFILNRKLIREHIRRHGNPGLVHVHVAMRAGVMALWMKRRYKITYLLTEHWTGYHKNAIENVYNKGRLFKTVTRLVIMHTELLLPDSHHLGVTIYNNIFPVKFLHISNVVNTCYFHTPGYHGAEFRFIHVSSMSPQKNTEGLLRAFAQLTATYHHCRLIMAGPASRQLQETAMQLKLDSYVEWTGAISYTEVATEMAGASALVMFSRYENQPCVILEALCSGLPVISTDVGGIPEVITAENGLLIKPDNEAQLLQAMVYMIDNYNNFNRSRISESAKSQYNYHTIGSNITALYRSRLSGN